jgi:hypothetical protein
MTDGELLLRFPVAEGEKPRNVDIEGGYAQGFSSFC